VLATLEITGVAKTLRAYDDLDWPPAERDRHVVPLDDLHLAPGLWPAEATELLGRLQRMAPDDPHRQRLRDDIIERSSVSSTTARRCRRSSPGCRSGSGAS
jgi:hypothetical protein